MTYRVGNHQPQNVYRDDQYIGVMFTAEDAALVVEALNGQALCPHGHPGAERCGPCSFDRTIPDLPRRYWGEHPPHPTCIDVTTAGYLPGSSWVCGPDCPTAADEPCGTCQGRGCPECPS